MASISIRQSIEWPPEPVDEPTSTVVLTSPQRRFVDVRILKGDGTSGSYAGAELEWAFAGTSSSVPLAGHSSNGGTHSKWQHWVSDRVDNKDVDTVVDEGDCVEQADGTMLETGSMVNPATGKVAPYKEVWLDVKPLPTLSRGALCTVLQLHDDAAGSRGVVERLGRYCQGISRTRAEGVTVERWEWTASTGWTQVYRAGKGSLPCKRVMDDGGILDEGTTVKDGDYSWKVVEHAELDE